MTSADLGPGPRKLSPRNVVTRFVLLALLVGVSAWLLWPRARPAGPARLSGDSMGTAWTVVLGHPPPASLGLAGEVQEILDDVESKMSTWREDSELSGFNRSAAQTPVPLSPSTIDVLQVALDVATASGGALDVTVGPVVEAWGLNTGRDAEAWKPPSSEALAELMSAVGVHGLRLEPEARSLSKSDARTRIDLSAVAKGYAVDRVAQWLDAHDVQDYMVEVGGEVRVRGHNDAGEAWRIGIETPDESTRSVLGVVEMHEGALATSGTYRNFVDADGRRYAHVVDPRTGRPVEHGTVSVSVRHASCAYADAWATALLVLGVDEGLALARRNQLDALFVFDDPQGSRQTRSTEGFEVRLRAGPD